MRTPRPASMVRACRWFGMALGIPMVLAACGGGGGSGGVGEGGAVFLSATPSGSGNSPDKVLDTPVDDTVQPVVPCAALAGRNLPASLISLPTQGATVVSATPVTAGEPGNLLGNYCRVRGTIQPVDPSAQAIAFALNLPEKWNRKTIHFGGGGFNGKLIDGTEVVRFGPADQPAPLALGYATYGSDSGHKSGITDAKFAANDEQLANYAGQSLKKTRDVAQALVFARYAVKPKHAYFLGTSTGGRDALSYIQRWPLDYDGVIANEPALNYTGTRLSNVAVGRALYADEGKGWLNVPKTLLVQARVKEACDKLDGVVDNIVSNVEKCRQLNQQILESLRCPGGIAMTGKKADTCLSEAQLNTLRTIESPLDFTTYSLANGVKRAGGYNILEGTLVAPPAVDLEKEPRNLGDRKTPGNPATLDDANMYVTGDQWVKYFVTRIATFDTLTFDPLNLGSYAARVTELSNLTDATNPNLAPFFAHGGRLILLHGLADEVISPNSTIDYYKQLIATLGQAAVDKNVRFYTVPGMGHGTGTFIPGWDSLAALEGWVDGGLAPETGTAVDAVVATAGRSRPLCRFPSWPRYRGRGSQDAIVNYSCGDPVCSNLPASVATYKGGNALGEELRVQIDRATMTYAVTFVATVGGTARAPRTGSLVEEGSCSYTSAENGAIFTFGAGGVLSGGVNVPGNGRFTPLLAFEKTLGDELEAGKLPSDVAKAADSFNAAGVLQRDKGATSYRSTGKLRDVGTFQYCADEKNGGFMAYDAACKPAEKGYITYNTTRRSFDVFTTPATDKADTVGGTLSGSMVIGMVNDAAVPLHLIPKAFTPVAGTEMVKGLRVLAPLRFVPGSSDGSYAMLSANGENHDAIVSGKTFYLGDATAALSYKAQPLDAVAQADAGRPGELIFNRGVLVFVSTAPQGANAALEFGVRH
ncbi:feruloyl esterase [Variovorax sp. OK605]|uniref:tannase/feruloyl esterase family alpha/beta hydrolase n=1 Tax=Variovorax sp. OK605 TaxID=1855317 RepID=UPI0008F32915|nr:tannase/feruloyl esterase family alpha/beta hydrolase [Variovorax sp. OK605]SFO70361.1 feruloyl esterase [Variovorax sp. OK605]